MYFVFLLLVSPPVAFWYIYIKKKDDRGNNPPRSLSLHLQLYFFPITADVALKMCQQSGLKIYRLKLRSNLCGFPLRVNVWHGRQSWAIRVYSLRYIEFSPSFASSYNSVYIFLMIFGGAVAKASNNPP